MRLLRSAAAVAISLCVLGLAPGFDCYHALGQTVTGQAGAPAGLGVGGAAGGVTAVPSELGATLAAGETLSPALVAGGLTISGPVLRTDVSIGAATPIRTRSVAAVAAPADAAAPKVAVGQVVTRQLEGVRSRQGEEHRGPTAYQGLNRELPRTSEADALTAGSHADADFRARTGEYREVLAGDDSVAPVVRTQGDLSTGKTPVLQASAKQDGAASAGAVSAPAISQTAVGAPRWSLAGRIGILAGIAVGGGVAMAAFGSGAIVGVGLYFLLIIPALILHEMGHAKAADLLGDPSSKLAGRLSFRPKDLLTHIDPMMTVVIPVITLLFTGFLFGGARPVMVNPDNFKNPTKDMAKVAIAGPAVNFTLALIGGLVHTAALAMGAPAIVMTLLTLFVFYNVMLGGFNLFIPWAPLDGHHVLRYVVSRTMGWEAAAKLDAFWAKLGGFNMMIIIMALMLFGAPFLFVVKLLTGMFLAGSALVGNMQLASAFMPAVAALSLMLGSLRQADGPAELKPGPGATKTQVSEPAEPEAKTVKLIVQLIGAQKPVTRDVHLSQFDLSAPNGVDLYAAAHRGMVSELDAAGLTLDILRAHGADPLATYRRINATTLVVPENRVAALKAALQARGFRVFDDKRREIVKPVPIDPTNPESQTPERKGAVTMPETLGISNAEKVHDVARAAWGEPEMGLGFVGRLALGAARLFGAKAPQPPVAVIDSGADRTHPQLKRIKDVKVIAGKDEDDIGHGSWVTSMVLYFAPWLKSLTHYKTFVGGGATTDDILKALTTAGNDGNIIMSNSWGSDVGSPDDPDNQLVVKLAEEGRIMVFANGNNGSAKNTAGFPASLEVKTKSGAPRIVAVAATDRAKKVVSFSSRGRVNEAMASDERYKDYQRPDLGEEGYNTEGAWPAALGDADRTDATLGTVKAISGTSMSTPKMAGTFALLAMLFGVTTVGDKLDLIAQAVYESVVPTSNGDGVDDIGKGFNHVEAAYKRAIELGLTPVAPRAVAGLAVKLAGRSQEPAAPVGLRDVMGPIFLGLGVLGFMISGPGSAIGILAVLALLSLPGVLSGLRGGARRYLRNNLFAMSIASALGWILRGVLLHAATPVIMGIAAVAIPLALLLLLAGRGSVQPPAGGSQGRP